MSDPVTSEAACAGGGTAHPSPRGRLGITVWSFVNRLGLRWGEPPGAGWEGLFGVLETCAGAGGRSLQTGVWGWEAGFASRVRGHCESLGLGLEGQIALPWSDRELERFDRELGYAREAGMSVVHTVALNGRRYEAFATREGWNEFAREAKRAVERAEPLAAKHKLRLAIENHKDWLAEEQAELTRAIDSEWVGVALDFGNNLALLEPPDQVVDALLPFAFTVQVKDMALARSPDGFLMSEVPLGRGRLDIGALIDRCESAHPGIVCNLEMITRDPLLIPVNDPAYGVPFGWSADEVAGRTERMLEGLGVGAGVGEGDDLPRVGGMGFQELIAVEQTNIEASFGYSDAVLGCRGVAGESVTP